MYQFTQEYLPAGPFSNVELLLGGVVGLLIIAGLVWLYVRVLKD